MKSLSTWQRWSGSILVAGTALVLLGLALGQSLGGSGGVLMLVGAVAYVASACVWAIASVWDAGVMLRRLLLIWLPAGIPVAIMTYGMEHWVDDELAWGGVLLGLPTLLILLICFIATAAAFFVDA